MPLASDYDPWTPEDIHCTTCVGGVSNPLDRLASMDQLNSLYNGTPWISSETTAGPDGVLPLSYPEQLLPASFIDGLTPTGPRTLPRPGAISKTRSGWVLGFNSHRTQEESDWYGAAPSEKGYRTVC